MHDTRTSSSLMASYRFARFFCVYFRYAANVNIPEGSRERSTSRSGVKALSLAIVVSNKKGNQHLENHLVIRDYVVPYGKPEQSIIHEPVWRDEPPIGR